MNILLATAAAMRLVATMLAPVAVLFGLLALTFLAVVLIAAFFRGGRR